MAKDTLDAVKNAEQGAEKILENAAHRCAAIRADANGKAGALRAERLERARETCARLKSEAQADAEACARKAEEETAAGAEQLRRQAQENSAAAIRAILDRIIG